MIIDLREDYDPTDKQRAFHGAAEMYKLYGGAMGGGKSRALCEEGLQLSLEYAGNFGVIARQTLPELKATTLMTFFNETLPEGSIKYRALVGKYNRSEGLLTFRNGSKILFTGLDSDNIDKIKSMNLGWFAIDEATEVSEDIFNMFCTRLRLIVPGIMYFGLLASNPEPGWVKKRFIDRQMEDHIYIPALPKENPHLPKDYIKRFDALPEHWRRRYLEGNWDVFEGQIYTGFSRDIHVIDPFKPPKAWRRVGGLDHGLRNATAILWGAVDFDDDIYVYQEHYEAQQLVSHHAEVIKAQEPLDYIAADPSIRNRNPVNGKSVQQEYRDCGVYNIRLGNNDVPAGINRVSEYLKLMPHPDKDKWPEGKPRLFICRNCANLIEEITEYKWKDVRLGSAVDDPEQPQKIKDHAVDALRYLIMSRPHGDVTPNEDPALEVAFGKTGY